MDIVGGFQKIWVDSPGDIAFRNFAVSGDGSRYLTCQFPEVFKGLDDRRFTMRLCSTIDGHSIVSWDFSALDILLVSTSARSIMVDLDREGKVAVASCMNADQVIHRVWRFTGEDDKWGRDKDRSFISQEPGLELLGIRMTPDGKHLATIERLDDMSTEKPVNHCVVKIHRVLAGT